MGNMIPEFMTHWDDPRPIWFERDEDELIGTQRSGGRPMPRIRIFDLFQGATNLPGFKAPVLWKGEDAVVEAHNPNGPQPIFHRPADYDVLFFQFSGRAAVESEYGEFHLSPGDSMHIPAGLAYRLAYFGRSLVMLTSVGGIAVGLWLTRHGDLRTRMAGASVGAVVASIAAEAVHLVYHVVQADVPDHGGFWVSAVLVGLINAAVVIPVLWVDAVVTRRRALRS